MKRKSLVIAVTATLGGFLLGVFATILLNTPRAVAADRSPASLEQRVAQLEASVASLRNDVTALRTVTLVPTVTTLDMNVAPSTTYPYAPTTAPTWYANIPMEGAPASPLVLSIPTATTSLPAK